MDELEKKIDSADVIVLKKMNEKLEESTALHSQIRIQFLEAEATILKNRSIIQGEMRKFMEGLAKSKGIPKEDLSKWRVNLDEERFESLEQPPKTEPAEVPAKPQDPEEKLLDDIKKRWK